MVVTPSKGQTGGSGFGSEGTYSSEQAARSAVASGTRTGAIIDVEDLAAKRRLLESPTAQWASKSEYETAYLSYLRAGGSPHIQPAGVIPGSTESERRAEAAAYDAGQAGQQQQLASSKTPIITGAMQRSRFDYTYGLENLPGIPKEEWLAKTREGKVVQVVDKPHVKGYQWVTPERELTQHEKVLTEAMPKDIGLSRATTDIARGAQAIANSIRSADKGFVRAPGFDPGADLWKHGKESVARVVEFAGIVPGTVEVVGQVAVKEPSALPMLGVLSAVSVVGGIAKQAETEPVQLISDLVVTAGVFRGIGKAKTKVTEAIKFRGKEFVPPETIIDPQAFKGVDYPVMPEGATPIDMVAEFKKGEFRLPGTEGKTGGWHATPSEWAKETVTTPGSSELPGTYIAPATVPHYWQINRGMKLFGWDAPPETPTGIWMGLADIRRSPPSTWSSLSAQARFFKKHASKDVGYISSTFEKGIKREKEAIIPPEATAHRVRFDQYTEWEGRKIPLMEYTFKRAKAKPSKTELPFREFERQQIMISRRYDEYKTPLVTPESLITSLSLAASRSRRSGTPSSVRSSVSSPQKSVSRSVSQAVSRQISSVASIPRPGYPSTPRYPGYPSTPRYPGYPSTPRYPGYPSTPRYPGYPSTPRYPGYPSTPFVPTIKPPVIMPPRIPKYDGMGRAMKRKGRKAAAYTIRNPFATLKDVIGSKE